MEKMKKLLLVDDDESLCRVLEHQLNEKDFLVTTANNGKEGLKKFENDRFEIVVTDIAMSEMGGMELLKRIREKDTSAVVILITAFGTVENAVEACRSGADDYITKPFSIEQLYFVIEKALRQRQLEKENLSLKAQLDKKFGLKAIVGQSVSMQEVYRLIQKVAPTDTTVLIQGESGTGKELVARAIHTLSSRKGFPFVPVDCAAIPENLLESELFGHVKGSFTGAIKNRKGKFETAEGGTLFLDEIGDLKESLQAKLLRTLQEKQIVKVGSNHPVPVNVRIIAATNQNLDQAVSESRFRQDLYYRIAVFTINIPPLRERREDIPELIDHFVKKYAKEKTMIVEKEVYQFLISYHWPGNVRELENVIERATVLADGDRIQLKDLPENLLNKQFKKEIMESDQTLATIEKQAILKALKKANGNQSQAARMLGIPRHMLLYRMKKWGIQFYLWIVFRMAYTLYL